MAVMDSLRNLKKMEGMTDRLVWLAIGVGAGVVAATVASGLRSNGNNGDHENGREKRTWRQRVDGARTKVAALAGDAQQKFDRLVGGDVNPDSPAAKVHNGLGWVATHAEPHGRRQTAAASDDAGAEHGAAMTEPDYPGEDADRMPGTPAQPVATPAAYFYGYPGVESGQHSPYGPEAYWSPTLQRYLPPVRHLYPRV
jgi:hypothetical protein